MQKPLQLSTIQPIASGAAKTVYQHPSLPGKLIKIAKVDFLKKQPSGRFSRLPRYWEYVSQIIEHLAIREQLSPHTSYIENIHGLIDTDLGVGLVVDAITTSNGSLAPTIKEILLENGDFSQQQQSAFEDLLNWVKETNIIIRDFSTNNVVWNETDNIFVIIDGIGGKPFFSLRNIISSYNLKTNFKKAEKLRHRVQRTKRQAS